MIGSKKLWESSIHKFPATLGKVEYQLSPVVNGIWDSSPDTPLWSTLGPFLSFLAKSASRKIFFI